MVTDLLLREYTAIGSVWFSREEPKDRGHGLKQFTFLRQAPKMPDWPNGGGGLSCDTVWCQNEREFDALLETWNRDGWKYFPISI